MGAPQVRQLTPGFVPESTYEEVRQQLDLLKSFIGQVSIDEIKRLQGIEKELAVVKAQLQEQRKANADLKVESDKRASLVKASTLRDAEIEKGKAVKNKEYNMRERVVKPLKKEKEQVEIQRDEAEKRYQELLKQHQLTHKKLDDVLANQEKEKEKLQEILEIINSGASIEEVKQEVKKIISDDDIEGQIAKIKELLSQGLNQKQIAGILYPTLALTSAQNKVKRRIDKMRKEGLL